MKQIWITAIGPPEVLKVSESADLIPGPSEVVIGVKATGLNFADVLARQGLYPDAPKPPCVVGYEVAGVVESVGEGVDRALLHKEVIALTHFGGHSSQVRVSVGQVFPKPARLTFEEAAALPVNYMTAHQLIVVMGALKADETILVHNAGGGVGLAALDLVKNIGATAWGTASPGKHDFLKSRGYARLFDYRSGDWAKEVALASGRKGVDLILDPIGGQNWRKSYGALGPAGRLGAYGVSSVKATAPGALSFLPMLVQMPWFQFISLMNANKGVFGVNLGHMWSASYKIDAWMKAILDGVEVGWIQPHVDKVFAFEEAAQAHQYLADRKNIGKVLLRP